MATRVDTASLTPPSQSARPWLTKWDRRRQPPLCPARPWLVGGHRAVNGDLAATFTAIAVMIVMVIGVNVIFWRPFVAWAEKFRVGTSEAADAPRSVTLNLLRRSHVPAALGPPLKPAGRALDRLTRPFGLAEYPWHQPVVRRRGT